MEIKLVNINKLKEAEYNPRQLTDKQFDDIKKSINKFGFVEPIIINSNPKRKNIVIGGHQRLKVARFLNIEEIPVNEINLSESKEKELNIRLNANTGEWDWDKIANEWGYEDLQNWGLTIPVTDFSNELLDVDENKYKEEEPELLKDAGSSHNFKLFLSEDNKTRVVQVLNQVKVDYEIDSFEDALVIVCSKYVESKNAQS